MRKSRISPKKSTLKDLEGFIDPTDASLNTPVISNYNTLPVSETPYIDQSEFTNTNPSFGVYANGPQQGRNRRPFGPTYRTPNPEYQTGGPGKSNLKELLDASTLHGAGKELNYQMTGDENLDNYNLRLLNARFKHLNKKRTEAYADSSEFKTIFDKHLNLLDSIEHARVDEHDPKASKWTPSFISDTPTVDNNLLQTVLDSENEVYYYDSDWIPDASSHLKPWAAWGRDKVHTDLPFMRSYPRNKDVADTLGYDALKDVISRKKGVDNAVRVKTRLSSDTQAVAPIEPIPWTLKTTAPTKPKDTPTSEPVVKKVVEPIQKTMATPIMGYEERPQWSKDRAMMNRMKQYAKPSKPSGRLFTAHENMAKEGRATRTYNSGDNTGERKVVANYQMGGQAPTRLDSINLLQNNKILADLIAKGTKDVEFEEKSDASQDDMYNSQLLTREGWPEDSQGLIDALNYEKKGTDPNSSPPTRKGNLVGAKDWWHGGGDDDDFPTTYRHRFIDPQGEAELTATPRDSSRISKSLGLNERQVHIYTYDDLAITPFDMLTPEQKKMRVEKYGSKGVPDSYIKNQTSPTRNMSNSTASTRFPPPGNWWNLIDPMEQVPVKRPGQLQVNPLQEDRLTPTAIAPSIEFPETTRYTAAEMPMVDTKARREGRLGNTVVPRGDFNKGDNKGRVEILQNGGLPKYQNGGSEKEWQGDREAVNLMHTDGKKYSYNQLRELGYPDSTIVRNWNLDITPEPKSRTTMAESVMGFEQRPVEKTMTRGEAFRQARAAGEKEFTYEGKRYTTELASDKKQTMYQSVPTPVTPKPYVSPYAAPYENMSREQLEEHIKQSWTKSEPYGDVLLSDDRQTALTLTPEEERKMGFVSPTGTQHTERFPNPNKQPIVGEGFLYDKEAYVLEKNGQNPKAVTHLSDFEDYRKYIQATEAANVFKKMKWMTDEEIRKGAGQLDSIYSVSPTFNPMSVYDQTVSNLSKMNLFDFGSDRYVYKNKGKSDTITTPRPTRPTESTTIEFRDGGLHRYQ